MNHTHILITRPRAAGKELCQLLTKNGYKATHFPTIDFAPYPFSITMPLSFDWFIFTSPQAVHFSANILSPHTDIKIAAVGEGTAKVLMANGFSSVTYPVSEWNSEGLLALPEFKHVARQKIAIIGGLGGRELLQQTLHTRGAEVTKMSVYQRTLPSIEPAMMKQINSQKIEVMVCTSCEGLLNLIKLLAENLPALYSIPLIVSSFRIKKLAQELNFQTIWLTPNATHQSILQTLAQKKERIWQMKS